MIGRKWERGSRAHLLSVTKSKGHGGEVAFSVGFGEPGSSEAEEGRRMDAVVETLESGLVLYHFRDVERSVSFVTRDWK
jgi:hypothetical protein